MFDLSLRTSPRGRAAARWRIELFGGIRATRAGHVVGTFRTRRAAVLLARLALHPRAHRREELVEMFWPACHESAGRQNLSQALSELRRRLGSRLVDAGVEFVRLASDSFTSDAAEFDDALHRASLARGEERLACLAKAVQLANGPLLPGIDHVWAVCARESALSECDAALRELATVAAERGELLVAFELAWRRVRLDPFGEDANRELARLYRRSGRTLAALEHLQRFEQNLRRAIGLTAEPETGRLAAAIARDARALGAARPPRGAHFED